MKAHLITISVFILLGLLSAMAIYPQYVSIFLIGTLCTFIFAWSYWWVFNFIRWNILKED